MGRGIDYYPGIMCNSAGHSQGLSHGTWDVSWVNVESIAEAIGRPIGSGH